MVDLARRRRGRSSKALLNEVVDRFMHPLFERDRVFVLADGLLHAMIEQNPRESVRKFVIYNFPRLIPKEAKTKKKR